jgi:hypothetical protein
MTSIYKIIVEGIFVRYRNEMCCGFLSTFYVSAKDGLEAKSKVFLELDQRMRENELQPNVCYMKSRYYIEEMWKSDRGAPAGEEASGVAGFSLYKINFLNFMPCLIRYLLVKIRRPGRIFSEKQTASV